MSVLVGSIRSKLHSQIKTGLNLLQVRKCIHDEAANPGVKRTKLLKKLFSTLIFGATLGTAIYFKHKRTNQLKNLLHDSKRLPIDENYENKEAQHTYLYNGYVLHLSHLKVLQEMADSFQSRNDDIFVISFPKAGTSWVQEIVYLIGTNLDYKKASSQFLETRFPYLEHTYPGWKSLEKSPSVRFIKTHMPYSLLPKSIKEKNCKIIYIARNPKDVMLSYYFFARMMTFASYRGTLIEFFNKFIKNEVFYAPYWNHVYEFWNRRNNENILFIKFEDLHKDLKSEIKRIAAFLDKGLTDDQVNSLAHHVNFTQMACNPSVNYSHWDDLGLRHKDESTFYRKGIVGDWKNYLTKEMNDIMDQWIKQNLIDPDFCFDYE